MHEPIIAVRILTLSEKSSAFNLHGWGLYTIEIQHCYSEYNQIISGLLTPPVTRQTCTDIS